MDTFCVNPYYLKTVIDSEYSRCCWLPADADMPGIQQALLAGQAHPDCSKCWRTEQSGLASKRQVDSSSLAQLTGQSLEQLYSNATSAEPLTWQIKLGNDCNLRCKTCHIADSTQWYAEWNHYHLNKTVRGMNKLRTEFVEQVNYHLPEIVFFDHSRPLRKRGGKV
jgi:hypothetical protein